MDRGAWWSIVHGIAELNMTEVTEHTHTHTEIKGQHLTGMGLDMMEMKKEAMNAA